jgi:putative phosphoesterase
MKIAVISDIHGNSYALEEVLKVAKKEDVKKLLVLGDIVGYYYHPDRVLDLLNGWDYEIIRGNHEDILKSLVLGQMDPASVVDKYGHAHQHALHKLNTAQIGLLCNLPAQRSLSIGGLSFLMAHGSPWNPDQYIYPDATVEDLERCNSELHDFVLIGHTHYSFVYRNKNSTLINPGSVGQSRQVGGVAFWCMINTKNSTFELRATPYNTAELITDISEYDPELPYLKSILARR